MNKILKLVFLLISNIFLLAEVSAQPITVNARIDSTMMWMGNQTLLTFEISQQPGQKVITPVFSDTIPGGLELVEKLKTDTVNSPDGHLLVSEKYKVTSFQDSLLYIPAFPFVTGSDTVWSKSLSLKVVQPFVIDTASNAIADIKNVFTPKFDWKGFFSKVLLGLLILAIIIVTFILINKYIRKKPVFERHSPEKLLPPHVVALAELDKLKQEKPWQRNRDKEYHTQLTDVLRIYIEKIYQINAMEMTSEEIFDDLKFLKSENKTAYNSLKQILQLADLVKFAKWKAMPDEHELSLSNAYLFINETKKTEEPAEELKENVEKRQEN